MECLLEVTTQVTEAVTLNELAAGFTKRVARIVRADGVTVHWSHEANRRYLMLASHGLLQAMVNAEHCLTAGDCHCGPSQLPSSARDTDLFNAAAAHESLRCGRIPDPGVSADPLARAPDGRSGSALTCVN